MSLVRLLGFTTLACGCVVGRYREVATSREVTYVEEKGKTCGSHGHRRNHTVPTRSRRASVVARRRQQGLLARSPCRPHGRSRTPCDRPATPICRRHRPSLYEPLPLGRASRAET